jgi:hypothetical protein
MEKLRALWRNIQIWRKVNIGKELKEMPSSYLAMQFMGSTFVVTMAPTILVPATKAYMDTLEMTVPWWWALVGIWLAAFWLVQAFALVVSLSHGRALGEKVFSPTPKKCPYRFEVKPPRRTHKRR